MKRAMPTFLRKLYPSKELAAIIGDGATTHPKAIRNLWNYIKTNNLQDRVDRRSIHSDTLLKPIFLKDMITMFEMTKCMNQHLTYRKPIKLTYETVNIG